MFNRLWLGIRRHPIRAGFALLSSFTALWAFTEPIVALLNVQVTKNNWEWLLGFIVVSIIIAIISVWPKRSASFELTNTNTKVKIEFGDLFRKNGNIVIPVNEYFDSEIGKPVSPNSVHGAFVQNVLGGHYQLLDQAVAQQLTGKEIAHNIRPKGKHYKYEIGTTISIDHHQKKFFLFAMCYSDNDCKAYCTPALMLSALDGLWNKIYTEGNGYPVHMPLAGNGLSGVGLPPSQLLELILISLLKSVKERDLNTTVHIILRNDVFEKIDLNLIKNNWR